MKPASPLHLYGELVRRIHCVGVGGMGMAPLAVYLAQRGFMVTGEDGALKDEVRVVLERAGVSVSPVSLDCDVVVYSSAIKPSHPIFKVMADSKCRMVKRGELLSEVVRDRKLVAVCGSHGKTTTTAMLVEVLRQADFPADYILGGLFGDPTIPPAQYENNEWVVAEIDESDGTIRQFSPEITLTVNLDWDHADHYRELSEMKETFARLFERTRGSVLVSNACALSGDLIRAQDESDSRLTFGQGGDYSAEIEKEDVGQLSLRLGGRFPARTVKVQAWGHFNASNATAAMATAHVMGATLPDNSLSHFSGVRRRQAVLHHANGVTVLEDYAHHPTEVGALLSSLKNQVADDGRLIVVFQPHRYSRTAQFKTDFATALSVADQLLLLEVYGAGEAAIEGGTSADVLKACRNIRAEFPVELFGEGDYDTIFAALDATVRSGDTVAFVGAGSIDVVAHQWVARLKEGNDPCAVWKQFVAEVSPNISADTLLRSEEPLAKKTTMRVGGAARLYAEPSSTEDLQTLIREATTRGIAVHYLGRGSNLIVMDEGVDGLVISLAHPYWAQFEMRDEGRVWVGAGLRLKNLCGLAAKSGLVGFEFLEGVPGNVGGALRMNAGAMGGWMFDVVESVRMITREGEVKTMAKDEMQVVYRCCEELVESMALGAILRPAASADTETVSRQIDVYRRKRQESQPREPSAGCIFKNPPVGSAGQLIDVAGLKGARVGDAEVSSVHANFIVNRGHATGADVIALVRQVRAGVLAAKGISLEPEAQLLGRKWEDVL